MKISITIKASKRRLLFCLLLILSSQILSIGTVNAQCSVSIFNTFTGSGPVLSTVCADACAPVPLFAMFSTFSAEDTFVWTSNPAQKDTEKWIKLASPSTASLLGISAVSCDIAYISGGAGTILKTTDGGDNWVKQNTTTQEDLYYILMRNATTGFAVGNDGAMQTTVDGANWTPVIVPVGTPALRSIYFYDAQNGYATGHNGTILKTTDAGKTWTRSITGTTLGIYSIEFTSLTTGYAAGWAGVLLKTIDGGLTWNALNSTVAVQLNKVHFFSANDGIITGLNGEIRRTKDAGLNWTKVESGSTTEFLSGMDFLDDKNGYIVGGDVGANTGSLYQTNDGGINWDRTLSGTNRLYNVDFVNGNLGYAVGLNGTIYRYRSTLSSNKGLWITVSPIVNPTTYTVTGTTASGCVSSKSYTLVVNNLPVIGVSGAGINGAGICAGNSTTLTASGASTYTWTPLTGPVTVLTGTSITISPKTTTSYMVKGTSAEGCVAYTTVKVIVYELSASGTTSVCEGLSTNLSVNGATSYSWSPATYLNTTVGSSVTVSPTTALPSTLNYVVSGLHSSGCTIKKDISVTVFPKPTISVSGTSVICYDQTTTLTAAGSNNYTWSGPNLFSSYGQTVTAKPSSTASYTVTTKNAVGCSASASIGVTVNSLPVITAAGASICKGSSTVLTASGGISYSWTGSPVPTQQHKWSVLISNTSVSLLGVSAVTNDICYVSGGSGVILKTVNGGINWVPQVSNTTQDLYSNYFLTSEKGFAVGNAGTIRMTVNGGSTWTTVTSPTTMNLRSVTFITDQIGFITGAGGAILKTTNGGSTWNLTPVVTTQPIYAIAFSSTNIGYAVGYNGVMLRSADQGSNWSVVTSPTTQQLNSLKFASFPFFGLGTGANGTVIQTGNSGATWSTVPSGATEFLSNFDYATNSNFAIVVGGDVATNKGVILQTIDGGQSWVKFPSNTARLYNVDFSPANVGYAVGLNGTIMKYNLDMTTSSVSVSPLVNTTYTVQAINSNYCSAKKDVFVKVYTTPTFSIEEQCQRNLCSNERTLNIYNVDNYSYANGVSYLWTGPELVNPTSYATSAYPTTASTYTAKVYNQCFSATKSLVANPFKQARGAFPTLFIPNAFTPYDSEGSNDIWQVIYQEVNAGEFGYNATKYDLSIFNRWGEEIYFKSEASPTCGGTGFVNGQIQWNGRVNGTLVPVDVYVYKLILYNCGLSQTYTKTVTPVYTGYNKMDTLDSLTIANKTITDMEEFSIPESKLFEIYPNPTSGKTKVFVEENDHNATIQIVNVMGQIIYEQHINGNLPSFEIDLSGQAQGVYIAKLISGSNTMFKRIIKE